MDKKVKPYQYISTQKINIPYLQSSKRSLSLPLIDAFSGKILPIDKQIVYINQDEVNSINHCWGKVLIEFKKEKSEEN